MSSLAECSNLDQRHPRVIARLAHAPDIVLIYESGALGTRPEVLPLSIGDYAAPPTRLPA